MSDSSIVIIQGTVGLYTVATRCHRCFAVTLKYTEDSSFKILPHSLVQVIEFFTNSLQCKDANVVDLVSAVLSEINYTYEVCNF